jgi:hypothetical protein
MSNLMICTAHQILLGDQIENNEMGWACSMCMGEENRVQDLVGKPEGQRLLGRPRCRWEDNIKMDLQEVGWGAWVGLIWLRIGTGGA